MQLEIMEGWTVYLMSLKVINLYKAKIEGSRIGMCSDNIRMDVATIDANYRGCEADQGLGNIERRNKQCSGAGASHSG